MDDDYEGGERRRAPRRRTEDLVDVNGVVGWRLGQLENETSSLERRLDLAVTHEQLKAIMEARDAILAVRFVSRHDQLETRDWKLRLWLGVITALGVLIAGGELLIATHH